MRSDENRLCFEVELRSAIPEVLEIAIKNRVMSGISIVNVYLVNDYGRSDILHFLKPIKFCNFRLAVIKIQRKQL